MLANPVSASQLHRVLVTKLRHHGDVLLASPVFSTLKHAAPHADVDALVYADTAPMLAGHPAIAQIHTIDRNWKRQGIGAQAAAEWRLLKCLRGRRYDLVVHLTDHPRGAWLCQLLKPRWAVAPQRPGRMWASCFTHQIPHAPSHRHTVEANLDALRRIGLLPDEPDKRLLMVPGTEAETRVASLLHPHALTAKKYIHLHPASRWLFKCWPSERVATLCDLLLSRGWPIVLTAAPDPKEMAMVAEIMEGLAKRAAKLIDLSGQLSLRELAALTAQARLFIGVDSAPMHIAAAMGTPTVALFGPSDETLWGPWKVAHRLITTTDQPCRPCRMDGCGGSKVSECLTTLPVSQVLAACEELLAESAA